MLRAFKLALVSAALAGGAATAEAAPLYGVVSNSITDFTINGSAVNSVTIAASPSPNNFTTASLGASHTSTNGFTANDPAQATSGPGPFPSENTFSAQGQVGLYARADL